jgi:ATP-dependent RNA helicase DeaD
MNLFSDFPLREELTRAVRDMGFESPTPIQSKVIPILLSQPSDIIGLAQTGTGKTAAFGLPLLHNMDTSDKQVQALVLSPTRELCMQIQSEFDKYGQHIAGFKSVAVYGGVPIGGQIRDIKSKPQVIVATPGRLIDLLERKALSLESVKYVVLDEADEMLNMGFREDIDHILKNTPERQYTWLFSATMSNDVRGIAKRFMKEWKELSVTVANTTNENIDHQYYVTNHHNRFETLQRLLDFAPGIYGIIFTRTKQDCQEIAEKLMKQGYHVSPLHGDMDQKMRSKVMERFKNRTLQAIVATDVAARGIDVNDVTHVINYELPDDPEVYTHRSGRTARAGKSGICMSIVSPKEISNIRNIERIVKQKFNKLEIPDGNDVVKKKLDFYINQIEKAIPQEDFDANYLDVIHTQFETLGKDELIRRLIWLQLKDTIDSYSDSQNLNVGAGTNKSSNGSNTGWTRLFINLGEKDGLNTERLVNFIHESTDVEKEMIQRVTVREMSSFFNVRAEAADYIQVALGTKKFKHRKVRVENAEQSKGFKSGGKSSGGYSGGSGKSYGHSSSRSSNEGPRYRSGNGDQKRRSFSGGENERSERSGYFKSKR